MLGVGATFAGYQVERVLGQGGMGTVYLARHPRLPRNVALKLLNREVSTDAELTRRFEREADVVARLEHPGIVGVLDRGSDDGHLWIAMQHIRGTDAASWKADERSPDAVVRLLAETASALDYAHSCGVLHRDIKPANILISEGDEFRETHAVLTDFGIARLTDADNTKLTATGTFTATLAYGSPEQLSGGEVDHRSDQYSLACTLFALLAGRPPYAATNPGQVVMGHIAQPVPKLSAIRTDLPAALDAVLERAMAKDRDERFATCGEFMAAALAALRGQKVSAEFVRVAPTSPGTQPPVPGQPPQWNGYPDAGPRAAWSPPAPPPNQYRGMFAGPGAVHGPVPSKGTAVAAGIATLVVGMGFGLVTLSLLAAIIVDWELVSRGGDLPLAFLMLFALSTATCSWSVSGMLLLAGRKAGRTSTIVCSGTGAVLGLAAFLFVVASGLTVLPGVIMFLLPGFVSAVGLHCGSVRATGEWVSYRTAVRNRGNGH